MSAAVCGSTDYGQGPCELTPDHVGMHQREGVSWPRRPVPTMLAVPMGLYVGANRYDTDDEHVLHLWQADGSFIDLRYPKRPTENSRSGATS